MGFNLPRAVDDALCVQILPNRFLGNTCDIQCYEITCHLFFIALIFVECVAIDETEAPLFSVNCATNLALGDADFDNGIVVSYRITFSRI